MYDCSRLYFQLRADQASVPALRALNGQFTLPAILLQPPRGEKADAKQLLGLVEAGQALDAAVIIEDDIELAQTSGADGVHLSSSVAQIVQYEKAREALAADSIVGVNVGLSRHDAMTLGEAGADYIAFDAAPPMASDASINGDEQAELLAWWAEVFEIPCVGLTAGTPERAQRLIEIGADFVGLDAGDAVGETGLKDLISTFARQLSATSDRTLVHG
ncbi:MAG: thiamine phosphate synthase [Pseudomonadota bacterium]